MSMKSKLSVLLLTQFFYPDMTGTGKILGELFTSIDSDKFHIDVVSSRQEYGCEDVMLPDRDDYGKIKVYRTGRFFASKENAVGRIWNYLYVCICTAFTCILRNLTANKDVIVCVSNPPIMPLISIILRRKNQKIIYILHDLYPDIAIAMNVVSARHIFSRFMLWANNIIFKQVDKIVVLGEDMKAHLMNHYYVQEDKIQVIPNWASEDYYEPVTLHDKLMILYTGNMGRFHDLDTAVDAVLGLPLIDLCFVGEGNAKKRLMDKAHKCNNISFESFLNSKAYREKLSKADVLLVSLEKNLSGLAVPSKFYSYLSAGRPIICISDDTSEIARVITEGGCGYVINHGDINGFKEVAEKLLNNYELRKDMGICAHKIYENFYTRKIIVSRYEKLLKEI